MNPNTVSNGIRVLVACEESQRVCIAFRKQGFEAYSCDVLPCSGGHPEWHIHGDVLNILYPTKPDSFGAMLPGPQKKIGFRTMDGSIHEIHGWDLMISHPPCTYLCNSGVRWLYEKEGRWEKLDDAADFFRWFLEADIEYIAVENPIPHKYTVEKIGRSYDQCIQPYQFEHPERKATCLWLRNLPELQPTKDVRAEMESLPKSQSQRIWYASPGEDRAKERSKTFQGIADAMAEQWGRYILSQRVR